MVAWPSAETRERTLKHKNDYKEPYRTGYRCTLQGEEMEHLVAIGDKNNKKGFAGILHNG